MKKFFSVNLWKTICLLAILQMSTGDAIAQVPVNDECFGAINVIPNSSATCTSSVTTSSGNATMSSTAPSCSPLQAPSHDVWYSFVATAPYHRLTLSNVSAASSNIGGYHYTMTVYSGSCNSLTEVSCRYLQYDWMLSPPGDLVMSLTNLIVGATYYVQIASGYAETYTGTVVSTGINFNLCITTPPPVANDECAGAVPINGTFDGSNLYATESSSTATCFPSGNYNVSDVWYSFVPAATGNLTIQFETLDPIGVMEVLTGTCGNLTSAGCAAFGTQMVVSVTAGQTYYLRVYKYYGIEGNFRIALSGVPLPVTGLQLSGTTIQGKAQLAWRTLSEQNNRGFIIERSTDGKNFSSTGWISSKAENGNSFGSLNYTFTDDKAITGSVYYRIQQTDKDGKTTSSNSIALSAGDYGSFTVVAAPNPVKDKVTVSALGKQSGNAMIQVSDVTGKTVQMVPVSGSETSIDLSSFNAGIYILRYKDDNHSQAIKVIRQ